MLKKTPHNPDDWETCSGSSHHPISVHSQLTTSQLSHVNSFGYYPAKILAITPMFVQWLIHCSKWHGNWCTELLQCPLKDPTDLGSWFLFCHTHSVMSNCPFLYHNLVSADKPNLLAWPLVKYGRLLKDSPASEATPITLSSSIFSSPSSVSWAWFKIEQKTLV